MEEAVVKRVMPHSNEAEQAVIGSMLMDADAITTAMEKISEDDFYNKQYGSLFKAMIELYNEGKTCDLVTVKSKLEETGVPSEVVSLDFIRNILEMVPTSANIKQYAEIVYEKSVLRNLIRANEDIAGKCYAGNETLEAILEETEKKMFDLIQSGSSGDYTPVRQVVLNVFEKIEKASQTKGSITGLETGFTKLDHQLSGLQPSDMILIAARPSVGKTAFVLNITETVAVKHNIPVAIFSLEMPGIQIANRMLSAQAKVSAERIKRGDLKDDDWPKLGEALAALSDTKIYIDDNSSVTATEIGAKCRKMKIEKGLDLVIIDYLQLMSSGMSGVNRQQEVSDISRTLKVMANDLGIPVIALSQLNRSVEKRDVKEPVLSDLRESGSIEQDADMVIFLYREGYYNEDCEEPNKTKIKFDKHRNGEVGSEFLSWLGEYTKFANWSGMRE